MLQYAVRGYVAGNFEEINETCLRGTKNSNASKKPVNTRKCFETGLRQVVVSVISSGIETFLIAAKRYAKANIKVFQFCPTCLISLLCS